MTHSWICHSSNEIQHASGLTIRLLAGSWSQPQNITPACPKRLSAIESAQLIREGVQWASRHLATVKAPTKTPKISYKKRCVA